MDDQETIIHVEKKMLEHLGYHVTTCMLPGEALKLFSDTPHGFDLVITDLTMPGMTGDRLAVEMLGIRRDIPILLSTGFSESMTREKAKTLGIKALLMKPVTMELLSKTLRKLLDTQKPGLNHRVDHTTGNSGIKL